MMEFRTNFHTHTPRCNHASGEEREYIENAVRLGLTALGFSDHSPYIFDGDYYSGFRMRPEQLEDYVNTLLALREEYKDRIRIYIGLEAEYYPALFGRLLDFLKTYAIDYLIQGQHLLGNEIGGAYCGEPTEDPRTLTAYVDQVIEGMETGAFLYLAHPDLIHFTGDRTLYKEEMKRLCRSAKRLEIPLEINMLGIGTHRNYPEPLFWEAAGEEGCKAVIGSDAHAPERILIPEVLQKAEEIARINKLELIDPEELLRCSGRNLKDVNKCYE